MQFNQNPLKGMVVKNNNLIDKYLSFIYLYKQEFASDAGQFDSLKKALDEAFSDKAKELYPNYNDVSGYVNDVSGYVNDVSGYVDLLKRAISMGLIDSTNTFLCDDIKSINNYDAFLDLAKYAINAKVLSEEDKLKVNEEFLDRLLSINPSYRTLATDELSKLMDEFKKLYPNNNECSLSLFVAAQSMRLINKDNIHEFEKLLHQTPSSSSSNPQAESSSSSSSSRNDARTI